MHRLQIERYDQRDRIGKERVHVYRAQIASGALTLAAMVISDAAIPEFERPDLRREQRSIPEEAMAEQDRWTSATGILVIELGTIDTEHGHDQSSLLCYRPYSPAKIGMRAARIDGKIPPSKPTISARETPSAAAVGVSLKLNTTCVKLAPSVAALNPLKVRNVAAAPRTPPIAARINDSVRVPTKAGRPPNPIARSVAISVVRAATEEDIVLSAPARAPNAIAIASGQPSFWIRSVVREACSAKYAASDFASSSFRRGSVSR